MRRSSLVLGPIVAVLFGSTVLAAGFKDVHKTIPIDASGRVTIETHNGTIAVTTWNQPNVSVDARIEATEHPEDVQDTNIRVTGGGSSVNIESDYSAVHSHVTLFGISHTSPAVDYNIRVPATVQLRIRAHNAGVKITGIRNDVDIATHNGSVDVIDLDGAANVETHNGSVRIVYANVARPSRIETHNGSADVAVPAAARLTVVIDSDRSGALSTNLPATVKSSGSRSTSMINGGGPELRFTTHNGSMNLTKR